MLKFCAAIDETSRAYGELQEKLWLKVQSVPASTLTYIICYHSPPPSWDKASVTAPGQAFFYTDEKLASLPASRVRVLNLSAGGV
ncbi:MAG: hypothetical protein KGZ79_15215 [Dethiobacter sp.]|jgi:hypothetical protein|nr:hypothetical protein [Dethiobacter sp.]